MGVKVAPATARIGPVNWDGTGEPQDVQLADVYQI